MKNITPSKMNLASLFRANQNSDWQKSALLVAKIVFLTFALACLYLIVKPAPQAITDAMEEEINSINNIIFDTEMLEKIEKRQDPIKSKER